MAEDIDLVPVTKRKSKLSLILIVLLVLVSGAAGFFAWRYFSVTPKAAAAHEESTAAEGEETESADHAEEPEHGASGERGEKSVQSTVLNFEPFLVNLADRDASRYLRITIKLQVSTKNAAEKIASAEVLLSQMRDSILSTLSAKNADQITSREGKDQLKSEITEKLNSFLPGKPIKAVFFTDFVVQL